MAGPLWCPTRESRFRVGHREILYPRRKGWREDRKWGDARKKKRERGEAGGSLCRMPPPPPPLPDSHGLPWFALVITWHYPTVFLWTVNAVPWISSKRCLPPLRVANAVSSKATPRLPYSRLPASIARVSRVPRNLSSISYRGFISYAVNRENRAGNLSISLGLTLFSEEETFAKNGSRRGFMKEFMRTRCVEKTKLTKF